MRRHAFALVAAATLLAPHVASAGGWHFSIGDKAVSGSGTKVTQPRSVGEFKAIRLEGSLDVNVKVGAATAVSVTIDDNLQPEVLTRLDGDTLVIETRSISYRGVGRVEVSTPALHGFAIEGSGDAAIDGGQGDLKLSVEGSGDIAWRGQAARLQVAIAGSGDVKLDGAADEASLEIDGSGDIHARALTARSADVQVSGSGDVEVTLGGGALRAEVNGSGDVHWFGSARVERVSVNGSGEIARR